MALLDFINTHNTQTTMRVYSADSHQNLLYRPYLKNRFLDPIAYHPVSGVDMPGHFCEFIGPRWRLPFGPGPLGRRRVLNCLLQFRCVVRGLSALADGEDWCSARAVSAAGDAARAVTTSASRATVQLLNWGHQKWCIRHCVDKKIPQM